MRIEIGERQNGKTTRLAKEVEANPNAIMIVMHYEEQRRIERKHPKLKGRVFAFASNRIDELSAGRSPETVIYLDQADYILRQMFHLPIAKITMAGTPEMHEREYVDKIAEKK